MFYRLNITVWLLFALLIAIFEFVEPSIKTFDAVINIVLLTVAFLATCLIRIVVKFVDNLAFWKKHFYILTGLTGAILLSFFLGSMVYLLIDKYFSYYSYLPSTKRYTFLFYFGTYTIWLICYLVISKSLASWQLTKENDRLQTALTQAKLDTLKGQINPHFIFNSLNNIRSLILMDKDSSREMLTHLSDALRYSLKINERNKVRLEEELDIVDDFLALSKIQLAERLKVVKRIDENCLEFMIPPMIIQLLVENAIKHGISKIPSGGALLIDINTNKQNLIIMIENPLYETANSSEGAGVGLKNIRHRLELLYSNKASLKTAELNGKFVANINIPLELV